MIGIIIRGRDEKDGGGYTLTHELLDELLKFSKKNFFFILINDNNKLLEKKIKKKKFLYKKISINKNLLYIINFIKSFFNNYFVHKIFLFDLNKIVRQEGINLVWFLSSEFYYPIETKYIVTVWDLMHITHKRFNETGAFFLNFYRKVVINNCIKNAHKIIVGSNYLKKVIKSNIFIKQNKDFIFAKHPTPQIFLNKIKKKKNNFFQKEFFFYPANFWEHKNHKNLLLAFQKFNKNNKYNLILTGDTINNKYYIEIKKFIEKKKITNTKILGFVSQNKLINLYDQSLGLIYPSYSGPENIPPLESFARGKPVAISNYIGAKEQLKNNAFYFNPNSIRNISNGFRYLIQNSKKKKLRQKLKHFAKLNISKNYLKTILRNLK